MASHFLRNRCANFRDSGEVKVLWPGGGITFMADVTRMPLNAFGYVPTPALVAPIEFTMRLADYSGLGGYVEHVRPLSSILSEDENRQRVAARAENPWPLESGGNTARAVKSEKR